VRVHIAKDGTPVVVGAREYRKSHRFGGRKSKKEQLRRKGLLASIPKSEQRLLTLRQRDAMKNYIEAGLDPSKKAACAVAAGYSPTTTGQAIDNVLSKPFIRQRIVEALGVQKLLGLYVRKYGVVDSQSAKRGRLELSPILSKNWISYGNTVRQPILALKELDARKQTEPAPTIAEIITEYDEQAARDQAAAAGEADRDRGGQAKGEARAGQGEAGAGEPGRQDAGGGQ